LLTSLKLSESNSGWQCKDLRSKQTDTKKGIESEIFLAAMRKCLQFTNTIAEIL
jgi:hypothetical protein